jgi:type II secretory pathway component PulJ
MKSMWKIDRRLKSAKAGFTLIEELVAMLLPASGTNL